MEVSKNAPLLKHSARCSITKPFIQNNKKPRLAQTGFYKYMLLIIFWGQALV